MMVFLGSLKNKPVRTSSRSSLDSAASLPNSGLTFIDNFQGASAAVSELSGVLDDAIEQINVQGNLRDGLKTHLESLDEEAFKYANCGVPRGTSFPKWNPSFHEAELVHIALKCAVDVYETERKTRTITGSFYFEESRFIHPSPMGTTKAASFTTIHPLGTQNVADTLLPAFVVAIRGTENLVAHMVNLNGLPKDFPLRTFDNATSGIQTIQAHGGFLNGAEALLPEIRKELGQLHASTPSRHVVFTGHSAGGAIAALLYLKISSDVHLEYPQFKISCITFGSPPVVNPSPFLPLQTPNHGLALCIVNEYDLVTRSDSLYIRSLVALFRSIHKLPPLIENEQGAERASGLHNKSEQTTGLGYPSINFQRNEWALPSPDYHHVGKLILLTKHLATEEIQAKSEDPSYQLALEAVVVPPSDFCRMLFCRIGVHRRKEYEARVGHLLAGRFNGCSGW